MSIVRRSFFGLALASSLLACGKEDQSVPGSSPENEMNAIMGAISPFADAEIRMNQRMLKAAGATAGDSWVRKMIEHQKGGVRIARQVLTTDAEADVKDMARRITEKQMREIALLEKLVVEGKPDPATAALYERAIENMHRAMMAAVGRSVSETFHRKMLEHHQGAIALSDIALGNGVTGALGEQVERTKAEQRREVEIIEAKLRASKS